MEPSENQALLVRNDAFGGHLRAEAARSRRYGHPFAVFVSRPPEAPGLSDALASKDISDNLTALLTSGLVRECDVVTVLEEQRAIGVILPETNVAGAGAFIERLLAAISRPDHTWQVELFVYPEHQDAISELAKQAA